MADSREHGEGVARRDFLASMSALGVGGGLMPGLLWSRVAEAQSDVAITEATVAEAQQSRPIVIRTAVVDQHGAVTVLVVALHHMTFGLTGRRKQELPGYARKSLGFLRLDMNEIGRLAASVAPTARHVDSHVVFLRSACTTKPGRESSSGKSSLFGVIGTIDRFSTAAHCWSQINSKSGRNPLDSSIILNDTPDRSIPDVGVG